MDLRNHKQTIRLTLALLSELEVAIELVVKDVLVLGAHRIEEPACRRAKRLSSAKISLEHLPNPQAPVFSPHN